MGGIIIWELCENCHKTNRTADLFCPDCRAEIIRKECHKYQIGRLASWCLECEYKFKCYTERVEIDERETLWDTKIKICASQAWGKKDTY